MTNKMIQLTSAGQNIKIAEIIWHIFKELVSLSGVVCIKYWFRLASEWI